MADQAKPTAAEIAIVAAILKGHSQLGMSDEAACQRAIDLLGTARGIVAKRDVMDAITAESARKRARHQEKLRG